MSRETPGEIITFYSYKGGTGRSMALSNVACLLADQLRDRATAGGEVLMIDWDLEAPGLHRYFQDWCGTRFAGAGNTYAALKENPGLIELFQQLAERTPRTPNKNSEADLRAANALLDDVEFDKFIIETDIKGLSLMKAGRNDDSYSRRVNTFDWEGLYHRSPQLLRLFAERLAERYQYVLIDSRTGMTDISGICTMLLPERLVVVFTPNRQSLTGVRDLVMRATDYRRQSDDLRPLVVFPLPSRIEVTRDDLRNFWRYGNAERRITGYQPMFKQMFEQVYGLSECALDDYFDEVQIQQSADYAYGEEIAVKVEKEVGRFSLTRSFQTFTERLIHSAGPWEQTRKVETSPLSRVFLAYESSDGAEVAGRLRERFEQEGVPLWRAETEGPLDLWRQTTEAIRNVEFMVLVITPDALRLQVARRQWRYARQQGVCVYLVRGAPDLDLIGKLLWMRDAYLYDPELDWRKLVNDLNTRCRAQRSPFMADELPANYVARPNALESLLDAFLSRDGHEPLAAVVALLGAGGYGKTALAAALCHDERIQDAFDDGVLWVTLGENPGDLTSRVEDLIQALSGERLGVTTLDAACARLSELMADRDLLMVIDDVWSAAHLKPFLRGGRRCAQLITTRIRDVAPSQALKVDLDAMRHDEAVTLLGSGLPAGSDRELAALAARLGQWPLLLTLANDMLRSRVVDTGQSLTDALGFVSRALDKRGLTFFDARHATERNQAVALTLGASLESLNDQERARFGELAIFPADADIPLETLTKLWLQTGGLDEFDSEELCDRLSRHSLLNFDPSARRVWVHSVLRQFLLQERGADWPGLHSIILDAHRPAVSLQPSVPLWAGLRPEEPYLWDHLAYHLIEAGRAAELVATVKYLPYLVSKTLLRGPAASESDLTMAQDAAPDDETLRLLRRAFIQSAHLLKVCNNRGELAATLYSRLQHIHELGALLAPLLESLSGYLKPWRPLPDLPGPMLIRALVGHVEGVNGCAVSPDGLYIVSASKDKTLKIWDMRTGIELLTLTGHMDAVTGCAFGPDCRLIVSSSDDRTLKVWAADSGALLRTLVGHSSIVTGCAFSPDGNLIASSSEDRTLKLWEAASGALLRTLEGHSSIVTGCAFSPDGNLIVSSSDDLTLKVWDAGSGVLLRALEGHFNRVTGCAFSPDGKLIASASADKILNLWETDSGALLRAIERRSSILTGCAFSSDSSLIASASRDHMLKLWIVKDGSVSLSTAGVRDHTQRMDQQRVKVGGEVATLKGHTAWVNSCAFSPDGKQIVSAGNDLTLRVWEVPTHSSPPKRIERVSWVRSCAVGPDGNFLVSASDDRTLKVWDARAGASPMTLRGHKGWALGCAISPDGSFIVSASRDKTLKIWEPRGGKELMTLSGHEDEVLDCAVSPDGRYIISASTDRTLRVWDARSGQMVRKLSGHAQGVKACVISPDGSFLVSASADRMLNVWDAESGGLRHSLNGHKGPVNGCAISPDGAMIVSASADQTLKIWDAESGQLLNSLSGHTGWVNHCAVSLDGKTIASASWDQTLRLWSAQTGELLSTFHADGAMFACAWFPQADRLAATGAGGVYWLNWVR